VEPAAAQTQAQERTRVEERSGLSGRRRPLLKGTRRGGQIGSVVVDGGGGDAARCALRAAPSTLAAAQRRRQRR
jgi:hypothetical protein